MDGSPTDEPRSNDGSVIACNSNGIATRNAAIATARARSDGVAGARSGTVQRYSNSQQCCAALLELAAMVLLQL
jgi:hypothetical protein